MRTNEIIHHTPESAKEVIDDASAALQAAIAYVESARVIVGMVEVEGWPAKSMRRDLTHINDQLHRAKKVIRNLNGDFYAFTERQAGGGR